MTVPLRRLLMTVDAVGGVWRYAMDLASGLQQQGTHVTFACFGPPPSPHQTAEARRIGEIIPVDAPLDWTASSARDLDRVPELIASLAVRTGADLVHLNLPSQAAGLDVGVPVVVVSHSCVVTWFRAVRGTPVPPDWQWQYDLNQAGFEAADIIIAPSQSHADLLSDCYDRVGNINVVHNSVRPLAENPVHLPFIIAAGRWWDDGKNARVLDAAAADCRWPVRMAGSQHGPNGQFQPIENADYLGELPSADLRRLIAEAAIFVSPSIYEPFGLAPLEAASAARPLLLADIPTYRELWNGAALFADPKNSSEFSTLLNRLSDDADLRADLGQRAKARAAAFTNTRQVDTMSALYAAALSPITRWATA